MEKIKSYLRELTIVTMGVLIALFLSNLKEKSQARKYQMASLETIKNEVENNNLGLKQVIEKHTRLLDTISKYSESKISIADLFQTAGGLQKPILSNTGLEFYSKNEINSINFEMMSTLISMNSISKLIETKLGRLTDYIYPNVFVDSKESKIMIIMYLRDVMESETQLMDLYKNFTDEFIKTTPKKQ